MFSNKITFILIFLLSILILSMKVEDSEIDIMNQAKKNNFLDSITPSRELAMQYCQGCHIFPEPHLLDKKTWLRGVLPNMALRFGLKDTTKNPYKDIAKEEETILKSLNIYPDSPIISREEWQAIVQYYEAAAPEKLAPPTYKEPISSNLPFFQAYYANFSQKKYPKTTLLEFDKNTSQLYIGDAQNELFVIDSTFQLKKTYILDNVPTDIDFPKNRSPRLLTIGSIAPNDLAQGTLKSLDSVQYPPLSISALRRPVQLATGDLNNDKKEDLIICQFGNNYGKLSWFDNFIYIKEHILKEQAGARKVEIFDFNKDKKTDMMVLMAQARESISILYNQGKGKFKEKTILELPPVYGVSYFELADFNKDGFQDILLTNGDNWDYSNLQKPYHGLRIYLNDGRDNFKETYFFPLYGASKAVARDFDNDGDLDIAAVSFYTDLENPEQGFIYLSNDGNMNFKVYSTPQAAQGKWLTMEVGDFDNDGDVDIALGSYFHTVGEVTKMMLKGGTEFPQLLILMNNKY